FGREEYDLGFPTYSTAQVALGALSVPLHLAGLELGIYFVFDQNPASRLARKRDLEVALSVGRADRMLNGDHRATIVDTDSAQEPPRELGRAREFFDEEQVDVVFANGIEP